MVMFNQSQSTSLLMQSGNAGMGFLKQKWTEEEVINLSLEEQNALERKAGALFDNKHELQKDLAKALSALANSGGGWIVLGQHDDGAIDGIPGTEGRTRIKDWLEQKVPLLLSYPLESFRIHTVERRATLSTIPEGREVIVIDVGDSRLAPHQATFPKDAPQYYFRQGGRSVPAPHHYLEALRNRLTAAVLKAQLRLITVDDVLMGLPECAYFLIIGLHFVISNESRLVCNKWAFRWELNYVAPPGEFGIIVSDNIDKYLSSDLRTALIQPIDNSILPTMSRRRLVHFGLRLTTQANLEADLGTLLGLEVAYSPISEAHIATPETIRLSEVMTVEYVKRMAWLKSLQKQNKLHEWFPTVANDPRNYSTSHGSTDGETAE